MVTNNFRKLSVRNEVAEDIEYLRSKLGFRSKSAVVEQLVKDKKTQVQRRG